MKLEYKHMEHLDALAEKYTSRELLGMIHDILVLSERQYRYHRKSLRETVEEKEKTKELNDLEKDLVVLYFKAMVSIGLAVQPVFDLIKDIRPNKGSTEWLADIKKHMEVLSEKGDLVKSGCGCPECSCKAKESEEVQ